MQGLSGFRRVRKLQLKTNPKDNVFLRRLPRASVLLRKFSPNPLLLFGHGQGILLITIIEAREV